MTTIFITAFISGASSGLGIAVTKLFTSSVWKVITAMRDSKTKQK